MPFELRGNCVHKTGNDVPIKCHDTREEAVEHLAALQANVPDAQESIRLYREAEIVPIGEEPTGKEWEVTIIGPKDEADIVTIEDKQFLKSKNNRLYDLQALENSADRWQGIKVFDNHLTDSEFEEKQGMRSVDGEWLGTIVKPFFDKATNSLKGIFKVVKNDLASKLLNAHNADVLNTVGLSIDTLSVADQNAIIDGQSMPIVSGFKKILSVDLVSEPAAGGGFNRILASENNNERNQQRGDEVAKLDEEMKAFIGQAVVDGITAADAKKKEEAEAEAERLRLEEEEVEAEAREEAETEAATEDGEDEETEDQPETVSKEEFQALECKIMLRDKLTEAKLTEAGQKIVRQAFDGRIFEAKELDAMIKIVKEADVKTDPTGRVIESGNQRGVITVGQNEDDKATLAFMRILMGNTDFRALEHNQDMAVLDRIPEAYNVWKNGDKRLDRTPRLSEWLYNLIGGDPLTDERASEAVTTSSMSSIVKNAVNLMIANDYSKREQWWEPIVRTEEVDTIDQATLVRLYGLNTLSVVNEGAPYTELDWADEEETPTFVKRGNYVGVTIEAMLRDKVQAIRTLPARLANSWFNSISERVAAVFTTNSATGPVLTDTGALFNATAATSTGGHANLLTTALSFTSFDAAYTAMTKQTDQTLGTGAQLGMEAAPKFLLVPTDLRAAALQIRNSEQLPGSANNDVNPHFQNFEVIVVPRWTDTNNWALVADPQITEGIWLIFLTGNRVPSIFTADNETSGAMFTNDQLRWKVRQMTYRFSATYDCAPVSDFRGLHKSNVA
jgi:hypothetical protein